MAGRVLSTSSDVIGTQHNAGVIAYRKGKGYNRKAPHWWKLGYKFAEYSAKGRKENTHAR